MSAALQRLRESMRKHDRVFVVVKGDGLIKRNPARVLEVLRAAARVRMEDTGRELLVRFADLETEGAPPKALPREQEKVAGTPGVVERSTLRAPLAEVARLPATPAPSPPKQSLDALRSSLSSYRELGRELARDAGAALAVLDAHLAALRAEAEAVAAEIKAVEAERAALEGLQRQLGDS